MSLFANLFEQAQGATPVTELLTDRNPFFSAAVDASGSRRDVRVGKKARKGSSVGGDAAAKVASRATPGTVKRRRKEHGVDDPVTQSKEDERVDVEDLPHETRETGAKHKKSKKAKGAHEPAPDWPAPDCETEPGIQKLKEAVQHAQLDSQSEDVQDESGSVDKEDAEEACQSASPTAMVQSGETQAETLKRTIFVGNLPQGTVSKDLKNLFKRFGSIESVRIRSLAATPDVKMSKALQVKAGKTDSSKGSVNAYVLFSAAEHADAAKALNMTKFSGQHIRVDRAAPPKEAEGAGSVHYDSRRSVFVGNLPRTVTDEDLISVFNSGEEHPALEGAVEAVRVVRDHHCRVGKGIAYILFRSKVAALAALRLHGSACGGREMRVTRVQSSGKDGTGQGAKRLQNKKMLPGGVHKKKKDGASKKEKPQGAPQSAKKKRTQKRPAVAARKAKAGLAAKS